MQLKIEVQKLIWLGSNLDDRRLISDFLKAGDTVEFDCHIYNKDHFQDHCSYFVIRAWKTTQNLRHNSLDVKKLKAPVSVETGCISEIFPRKGILVFTKQGEEER